MAHLDPRIALRALRDSYIAAEPHTLAAFVSTLPDSQVIPHTLVMFATFVLPNPDKDTRLALMNYVIDEKPLPETFTDEGKKLQLQALRTLFQRMPAGAGSYGEILEMRNQLRTELGHSGGNRRHHRTSRRQRRGQKKKRKTWRVQQAESL